MMDKMLIVMKMELNPKYVTITPPMPAPAAAD